ncbi:glutaminase kidney isoform, mitochondrial-like isoform 1 [Planoprotostelium fungivorum]|uniref:glutaminase n=1 Tax=Planoprotostelium fungivorum TaxID=1890364 RepID=A0A2P6ND41_9EUKA|nr:glutaminase kidney isoform, mitochondrial-like isoform 1 [Planoprotostelium fungivorum]
MAKDMLEPISSLSSPTLLPSMLEMSDKNIIRSESYSYGSSTSLKSMASTASTPAPSMFMKFLKERYPGESNAKILMKNFEDEVKDVFEQTKATRGGKNASYIKELEKVDPELFGVAVRTVDGHQFSFGDDEVQFSMQSTSKPLLYTMACEEHGPDEVHRWIGCEPSGVRFNAFTLNDSNKPYNPFVNTGAILLSSLIARDLGNAERYDKCLKHFESLAGGSKINFSNTIFLSERDTADRNKALAYFMSEHDAFPKGTHIMDTLDFYFQCCSMEVNVRTMSNIAATIANNGVDTVTKNPVLSYRTIHSLLILLFSCGMYDYSGQWAFEVGLPAKSGVSGCIFVSIPNLMGFCIYSPPLDFRGNSVRGLDFCRRLNERFNFHLFSQIIGGQAIREPGHINSHLHLSRKHDSDDDYKTIQAIRAAADGRLVDLQHWLLNEGVHPDRTDYDSRSMSHLAASEGHLDCLQFIIERGGYINLIDRWGNTPTDDAIRGKHAEVIEWLHANGGEAKSALNRSQLVDSPVTNSNVTMEHLFQLLTGHRVIPEAIEPSQGGTRGPSNPPIVADQRPFQPPFGLTSMITSQICHLLPQHLSADDTVWLMQDSSFFTGPPLQLVMEWIDELWAQECAPVTMSSDSQEENYEAILEQLLPYEQQPDFQLLEPLRTRQRKSYEGESRFLTPRPVIALHPSSPLNNRLKRCTVSVRLLDIHGSPLHCHEQTHLYGPYGKEALLSIPHGRTPPISVKIGGKCDLRALRLGFTIEYETDEGYCGRTHLTSNEVHLARKQCPNKRGTSSHVSRVNMLRRNIKCE